jgi:hypothetical protein
VSETIQGAVLDYFEGWFEGDAARMERALQPQLAKRTLGPEGLLSLTAAQMIEATAAGRGRAQDVDDRGIRIEVSWVNGPNATAIVHSAVYTEFVHLVETGDGWKIVNTLWQRA